VTRRCFQLVKGMTLVLAAGMVFGGLSCVMTAADVVGTGMTLGAATGVLGPVTQGVTAVTAVGAGFDLLADLVKYTPLGG
jgi:hypothetical protein